MVSPLEVMKGSILSFEGKSQIVKGVAEYIMFEGRKEWIGGSLINGEPITEDWLSKLGFKKKDDLWVFQPELMNIEYRVRDFHGWIFSKGFGKEWDSEIRTITYVHQLQGLFFYVSGEHLKLPKLK